MSVFANIVKKIKKEKRMANVAEKEQQTKSVKNAQDGKMFNLNSVFWVFVEKKVEDGFNVLGIPLFYDANSKQFSHVLSGKTFDMQDITKGDALFKTREESCDVCVFGVRDGVEYRNFRLINSGEELDLSKQDRVSSYNPNSPALLKLFSKSFYETKYGELFEETKAGPRLKEDALVSQKDIEKINTEVEKTYKQERNDQIEFESRLRLI